MDRAEIIDMVGEDLARVGHRLRFEIVEAGVRQDGNWWYVPVIARASNLGEPPYEVVVNIYANIEEQLQDKGIYVMFEPAAA